MKEERYFYVPDASEAKELPVEEAQHATRVLRLGEGDEIYLMDGKGSFFHAAISLANKKHCFFEIKDCRQEEKSWQGRIHLAIAPTKMMERMEWMVEKITEIGFDEITFLDCKFSERESIRTDRIEKIVISAMKQSRKPFKPVVNDMVSFKEFVDKDKSKHKFIAHCYLDTPRNYLFERLKDIPQDEDVTVLIGPEGDFSIDEVKLAENNGYEPITLGLSRLRTETAGLMAVTMAQLCKTKIDVQDK